MMPPIHNRRLAQPGAKNATLTAAAHGARHGLAATKQRPPSDQQERQAVVLTERMQILWTLQWLPAEKTDPVPATVRPIAIQYPK
jgi:hypothetical protein